MVDDLILKLPGHIPEHMCNSIIETFDAEPEYMVAGAIGTDGTVDEDLIQPCATACGAGYETCYDGKWISCNAPPVNDEICDGLDNDCDGSIDEGLDCVCTVQDIGVNLQCLTVLLCVIGFLLPIQLTYVIHILACH